MPQLAPQAAPTNPKDIHIGKRLRELRESRHVSQTKLGKNSRISFQQIQKYETGTNRISGSRLAEFAEFFAVSASYFFVGLDKNVAPNEVSDPQEIDLLKCFRAARPDVQHSILRIAQMTAQISA